MKWKKVEQSEQTIANSKPPPRANPWIAATEGLFPSIYNMITKVLVTQSNYYYILITNYTLDYEHTFDFINH